MRVLVTGAGGYVGGALVRRLLADGHIAGRTLDTLVATDLRLDGLPPDARLQCVAADLSLAATQDALFGGPLDTVFHLASVPGGTAEAQPALARRVNLDATLDLFDRCRRQVEAGGVVPRVVFASTIAVYGLPMPDLVDDGILHLTLDALSWKSATGHGDMTLPAGARITGYVHRDLALAAPATPVR